MQRSTILSFAVFLAPPHFSTLYCINGTIVGKKLLGIKCIYILICSTHFAWNISHYKNNSARYCHKCESVFMQIMHYSCRGLIKLEFSLHISGRIFQVSKFNQNTSSRSRVVPCTRTDGQTRQS